MFKRFLTKAKPSSILTEIEEENNFINDVVDKEEDDEEETPFERVNKILSSSGSTLPKVEDTVVTKPVIPRLHEINDFQSGSKRWSRNFKFLNFFSDLSASSSSNSITPRTPRTPKSARMMTPRGFSKYRILKCIDEAGKPIHIAAYFDSELNEEVQVVIKQQTLTSPRHIRTTFTNQALHEAIIQQALSDPDLRDREGYLYTVKFIDQFSIPTQNEHYLVMEYCHLGSMFDALNNASDSWPIGVVCRFLTDMLLGLTFMHDLNFVHRDIKCENIFFSFDEAQGRVVAKIGDFGFSLIVSPGVTDTGVIGSPHYYAPELVRSALFGPLTVERSPFKADMWCVGITLYCMLENVLPYDTASGDALSPELRYIIMENRMRPRQNHLDNIPLYDFIKGLLHQDVNLRRSAKGCLEHRFILETPFKCLTIAEFNSL